MGKAVGDDAEFVEDVAETNASKHQCDSEKDGLPCPLGFIAGPYNLFHTGLFNSMRQRFLCTNHAIKSYLL